VAKIVNPLPAGPTSEKEIAKFEKYVGHRLPDDYRAFLLEHNGGRPEPDALMVPMQEDEMAEDIVMCFFPMRDRKLGEVEVEELEELRTWPLHCAWDDLQNDLEELYEKELKHPVMPIGTDGSSNYFCITLSGKKAGSVVFLENEMAEITPLAPSFTAFLDMLRPRERTDYAEDLG